LAHDKKKVNQAWQSPNIECSILLWAGFIGYKSRTYGKEYEIKSEELSGT
jgi:hypothetical protein